MSVDTSPDGATTETPALPTRDRAMRIWRQLRVDARVGPARMALLLTAGLAAGLLETGLLLLVAQVALAVAGHADEIVISAVGKTVTMPIPQTLVAGLVVLVVRFGVVLGELHLVSRAGVDLIRRMRERLIDAYLAASAPAQERMTGSKMMLLLGGNVSAGGRALTSASQGLVSGATLITLLVVAVAVQPVAAVLLMVMLAALTVALLPIMRSARRHSRRAVEQAYELSQQVLEATSLALEVRAFSQERAVQRRVLEVADRSRRTGYSVLFRTGLVPELFTAAGLFLVLIGLGAVNGLGVEDVAGIGSVVLILLRAVTYARPMQAAYAALLAAEPYLVDIRATVDRLDEEREVGGALAMPARVVVRVDAVTFSYPDAPPVLKGLDLALPQPGALGLVGPSGAGKTTAVGLLLRALEPQGGRVVAVGAGGVVDAAEIDRQAWRAAIALVPQTPRLLSGTIADNIRFFRDVTDEVVHDAARRAHIDDEIRRLPRGYDTTLGELGVGLSGGQRQRICIARALLSTPQVLILDEPTSSLDARSESLVIDTLAQLKGAIGILVVAHRLSTLRACDQIAVLEDGVVTAIGTHDEVLAASEFYRRAVRLGALTAT